VAGVDVVVRSSWLIIAVVIAVIMAPTIDAVRPGLGPLKYLAGLAFAILLYLSVLLHEVSHAAVARSFGHQVEAIQLDFLGGVTQIATPSRSAWQEFAISVVGPLASLIVGAVALAGTLVAPPGLLLLALQGLAGANLIVGLLNLLPGLPLDGGRVLKAVMWGVTGNQYLATATAAWCGRVIAAIAFLGPVIAMTLQVELQLMDVVIALIVGGFMWSGSSATLRDLRIRRHLPEIKARDLFRRAVFVPDQTSVAEAIRLAKDAGARAIVVQDSGGTINGIANEVALNSVPLERRPWLSILNVSNTFENSMAISADLEGEELIRTISQRPANDYLLMEPDGSCLGVLNVGDLDRVFSSRMKGKR
jgi:Zn-dependent protease/CBS domain-containing protein